MSFRRSLLILGCVALLASLGAAQIDTATIVGTVTDASGAVVPNAKVTALNINTNSSVSSQTNSLGQYVIPALKVGSYTVTAENTGFRKTVQKDVMLNVQDRRQVDLQLQVGDVAQQVEVTTAVPLLNTQSADIGAVVDSRKVVDLPLNGRRYADLALLAPGVLPRPGGGNPSEARFNVNGNFSLQNNFTLDGAANNNPSGLMGGSPQIIPAIPDSLAEFKIQTRTFTAEFGESVGAVINATTKSGTNSIHGNAYHFIRNDNLDATDFFANRNRLPKPPLAQNQGGITLGGPVMLGKLYDGRNKTFFFGDWAFQRIRSAQTAVTTVPTAAMKAGNFSGLATLGDPGRFITAQAGCIVANVIQARCIDPVGQRYANQYPDPTVPGAFASNNFAANISIPSDYEQWDVRVDQKISDRDNFFVKYSNFDPRELREAGPFTQVNKLSTGGFTANAAALSQQAVTSWTHLFGSNMVNEARFSFARKNAQISPVVPYGSQAQAVLGLTGVPNTPLASGIPAMNVGGFSKLGTAEWRPQFQVGQVWQALDNLSYVRGTHNYKFGFEWKRYSNNMLDLRAIQGAMGVPNNLWVGDTPGTTGFAGLANLLLGNTNQFFLTSPHVLHNYLDGWSGYVQDTWRVKPNFTLNYGVRWEYFTPWIDRRNQTSNFDTAGGGSIVTAKDGGIYNRTLVNPDRNNFGPRLGFSWNPLKRMTLRGGYGVFFQAYDRIGSESVLQINPPHVLDRSVAVSSNASQPVFFLRNGYPTLPAPDLNSTAFRASIQMRSMNQALRTPYTHQISLSSEYEIARDLVFEIAAVANYGHKIRKLRNLNHGVITSPFTIAFPYQATFGNGYIQYLDSNGDSNFHSLQMRLEKRFSRGFSMLGSYTWSKALGNVLDNLSAGNSGGINITPSNCCNNKLDYGPMAFDQKHRLVVSYTYQFPVGRGTNTLNSGVFGYLLEKWSMNGISSFNTGSALTATGTNASGTSSGVTARANCLSPVTTGGSIDAWYSTGSFSNPAAPSATVPFTIGTCGPGTFYGPGINNWDWSLFKKIPVTEGRYFEFRAEMFNVWNHTQFAAPNTNISAAARGTISSVQVRPRQIQLGLKFYF